MSVAPAAARALDAVRAAAGAAERLAGSARSVEELAARLYADWFAGAVEPAEPFAPGGSRDLTEALRAAHAATPCFGGGWRARRVSSAGRVVAEREGELRLLGAADYVCAERPGLAPRTGRELMATERRDSLTASPGYWLTTHPGWPEREALPPLVRIYFNAAAADAPALVNALTAALAPATHVWALKLPVDAALHARRDAAVLYLPRAAYPALAPALAAAAAALRDVLAGDEPPLTLRLAPGIALAEDPGGEHSFGTSRCGLIAEGVAGAAGGAEGVLDAVIARLRAAGLDPERPHLEPGGDRAYPWPERPARVREPAPSHRVPRRRAPAAAGTVPAFRAAGLELAAGLAASAIWHEDRCTWLGDAVEPAGAVVTRSADGGLYGGTAGIGRFLALAGERRTALGALRHALAAAGREPPDAGGLWLGPLGAAWAALEAAAALEDPKLRDEGRELALRAAAAIAAEPAGEPELLGGEAGSIAGLLAVEGLLGGAADGPALLAAATAAADRLHASARHEGMGAHWPGSVAVSPYGLCGLAHGASGIALALGALAERTGDARHRALAHAALRYERRWFRGEAGGWPDLREATTADLAGARNMSRPALWCHGAAGIGLVRLAAYARDGRAADLAEAGAAIHAARMAAAATLERIATDPAAPGPAANWSLCHGLLGTAELMLCAADTLGEPAHLVAARHLGERALADRAAFGAWRCGVPDGGETPGLMLGLAGIGTTLLRLADPGCAPSPALPGTAVARS